MVELILFLGQDIYIKNAKKKDPEDLAYQANSENILKVLKMKKNKISIKYDMWKIREYDRISRMRGEIESLRGEYLN